MQSIAGVEYPLRSIQDDKFDRRLSTVNNARLDIIMQRLWNNYKDKCFDIVITHPVS